MTGPARHDAGLAALWLSHVDLAPMDEFLHAFHGRLEPGAAVLMFDERASEEPHTPASRSDDAASPPVSASRSSRISSIAMEHFIEGQERHGMRIRSRLSDDSWTRNDLLRIKQIVPWTLRLGALGPPSRLCA